MFPFKLSLRGVITHVHNLRLSLKIEIQDYIELKNFKSKDQRKLNYHGNKLLQQKHSLDKPMSLSVYKAVSKPIGRPICNLNVLGAAQLDNLSC
ncbi:hypothetical protein DPMN_087621 [Dreissena polymorpha]|uniref:Uncharacterized protein n=1 Tax=Dreissena polymorpha TaxID=45954 RepID=A0A9D4QWJ1_DREPO|nr:hypothetical protein DPMN_087621 [Dreissena polymorpha]